MKTPTEKKCPTCEKLFLMDWSEDQVKTFPFCSKRCKMIDLGQWLSDSYAIPVKDEDNQENE